MKFAKSSLQNDKIMYYFPFNNLVLKFFCWMRIELNRTTDYFGREILIEIHAGEITVHERIYIFFAFFKFL